MRIVVGVGVLASAVVTVVLLAPENVDRPSRGGIAAVLAVPAVLAVASLAHRPVLLLPAALLGVLLSPILFSGILLLLVPGLAYGCAYVSGDGRGGITRTLAVASVLAPVTLTILAMLVLMTSGTTERCVSDANSTSCSAVLSSPSPTFATLLAVFAVATGWLFATPVRSGGRSHRRRASARG